MDKLHLYDKILSPLINEKTTNLSEQNKIVFKVIDKSNKKNLKTNIEKIFKVNVNKINIIKNRQEQKLLGKKVKRFQSNNNFKRSNISKNEFKLCL